MEPIVAASHAILRPAAGATQADLTAVLRNGQVVVAEVLPGSQDGGLLLAIGRRRVPAKTNVALEPGRSYLLRVVGEGQALAFELASRGEPVVPGLLGALRRSLGDGRGLDELLRDAAARLRSGSGGTTLSAATRARLTAWIEGAALRPGDGGAELFERLTRGGLGYEAKLASASRSAWSADLEAELRSDAKGLLLGALEETNESSLRRALEGLVLGLEREQLLNLARLSEGEALAYTLPFVLGDRLSTARLFFTSRSLGPGFQRGPALRLVLAVDLPRLGALRVDLLWSRGELRARVLAERSSTLALLIRQRARLCTLLGGGRVAPRLSLRLAQPGECRPEAHPFDVRFLERQRLLDRTG